MKDHSGVLNDLVAGTWIEPDTGQQYDIGIKDIVIRENLDGAEAELIAKQHQGQAITVISDPFTHDALGSRVFNALKADGQNVKEYVWQNPQCSEAGVEHIREATRHCDVRIAVGPHQYRSVDSNNRSVASEHRAFTLTCRCWLNAHPGLYQQRLLTLFAAPPLK